MKNKQFSFWVFTSAVFSALLLPALFQDGMFLDGLVNSSIARNMAMGDGRFWILQHSKTIGYPFYDQPPLAFFIQSFFFKFLGDHLYVERIYCFLAAFITSFFIFKIWMHILRDNIELLALVWFPILLWIITPVVFWSYTNNMLENTMAIFDIAAIYLIIKALDASKRFLVKLVISGFLILAAFLSKGPVGLFPLATVFIYWFFFKTFPFSKTVLYSLIIILIPLVVFSLLLIFNHDAFQFISKYLHQQIVNSVEGKREIAPGRYFIIMRLTTELIPVFILIFFLFFLKHINRVKVDPNSNTKKLAFFIFTIALSASLPIIISLKQSGYYLVPSFPFFALAAGIYTAPILNALIQKINTDNIVFRIIKYIIMTLFCGTLIFSLMQTGKIGRDRELLKDIYSIGNIVQGNSVISLSPNIKYDWGLHAYMMRYFKINLDLNIKHKYYVTDKKDTISMNKDYIKLNIKTSIYDIYQHK